MAKCCHNLVEWFACNSTSSHSMGTAKALQTSLLMPNLRCFFCFFTELIFDLALMSEFETFDVEPWDASIPTEFLTHSFSITHGRQAKECLK